MFGKEIYLNSKIVMITILQKNNESNKINDLGDPWPNENVLAIQNFSKIPLLDRTNTRKIHMRKEALSYKICNQF